MAHTFNFWARSSTSTPSLTTTSLVFPPSLSLAFPFAQEAAGKLIQTGFSNGVEISRQREKTLFISTGAKGLDSVLGGFSTSSISEIYGGEWNRLENDYRER